MARKKLLTLTMAQDDGDDLVLPVYMRDVLAWETKFTGRSVSMLDEDTVKLTYMYEVAFVVAQSRGLFSGTWPEFRDQYDVSSAEEGDGAQPDPTQVAAATEPSSNSLAPPESPLVSGAVS